MTIKSPSILFQSLRQAVRPMQKHGFKDELLAQAFAVVREASRRVLGMRHHDVQLLAGRTLLQGKIAEMATGEGKTLVGTLPQYLNALPGKGVHIITVNDYLAKRDNEWMGQLYNWLGTPQPATLQITFGRMYDYCFIAGRGNLSF